MLRTCRPEKRREMRTSEIRQRWLDYFGKNGHELCPSVPLISPDPSILFTIAGMVPFIPYIVGTQEAPWPRAASVQKCIRTNDIEEVGKTTRHGTFFQMCGNFSFGDYFKEGASHYAWDLLTGSVDDGKYGLDGDRLWVTVWEDDAEAADIWIRQLGLDPQHVQKLPRNEIFWDTGQPGPAGPCAEIHFDRGAKYGPEGGPMNDPVGDRFLEIWNLVFDQYLRGEGIGKDYPLLGELDKKCIDTGLGLERLAFLLQDKQNMYEIDEVRPVIDMVEQLSGRSYGTDHDDDVRMRIVADHLRSALMLIGDGVRPGNDGRGYVLRRLIRRAVRSMRLLGVDRAVVPDLLPISKNVMQQSYPELAQKWETIREVAYGEEDTFLRTLTAGTSIFDMAVKRAKSQGSTTLSGKDAFQLHDTYGFPIDLTLEMAHEQGVKVDEQAFRRLMQEQKDRARQDALKKKSGHVETRIYHEIEAGIDGGVRFIGYTDSQANSRIVALIQNGKPVPAVSAPADGVEVIVEVTPFYAEMGGQLSDHGTIRSGHGATFEVDDVQAPIKGLPVHRGHVTEGTLALGDQVSLKIDTDRRIAIARAHTATHMVHKALHESIGEQATQAGSENSPSRMRFDFRHSQALSGITIGEIEQRVNDQLAEDLEVTDQIMDLDKAKASGAMALFGEKYGKRVRVVSIGGDWSKELCAGTHVPATGHIGRIAVLGESSIGSGVRRIDALVGSEAYRYHAREHAIVSQLTNLLAGRPEQLADKIGTMMSKLKSLEKENAAMRAQQLQAQVPALIAGALTEGETKLVVTNLGEVQARDDVRNIALAVRDRFPADVAAAAIIFGVFNGRPMLVVAVNDAARKYGVKAGELVRIAAKLLGGGGGGRDDIAQGGGQNPDQIDAAIESLREYVHSCV